MREVMIVFICIAKFRDSQAMTAVGKIYSAETSPRAAVDEGCDGVPDAFDVEFVLAAKVHRAFRQEAWGALGVFPDNDVAGAERAFPCGVVRPEEGDAGGAGVGCEVGE